MSTPNEIKYSVTIEEDSKQPDIPQQTVPPGVFTRGVSILEGHVSTSEGEQFCCDSKAAGYMECSSLEVCGVHDVIMETIYVLQECNNKRSAVCIIQ